MTKTPLVSVIVPVYNVEDFLIDCLDSIVCQTYENIEIICVNDGSSDDSEEIIDSYSAKDARIKKVNKKNQGPNRARQSGVETAGGEFIMFVDADDIIADNCIEYLLQRLHDTGTDISIGGYKRFTFKESITNDEDQPSVATIGADTTIEWLLSGWLNEKINKNIKILPMTTWAKLYKSSVVRSTNWRISDYYAGEDNLEVIQWYHAAKGGVTVSTKSLYFYRTNPKSITQKKYYNINPDGKEITRFEFANEWRKKVNLILGNKKYTDSINQRFMWMMQHASVEPIREEGFSDAVRHNVILVVKDYQNSLQHENTEREKLLKELRSSRSWRITKPVRVFMESSVVRFSIGLLYKILRMIRHPRRFFEFVWRKTKDIRAAIVYRNAWVITDRPEEAADNGILFYDYMAKNHPEVNAVYVISRHSDDYKKLKDRGVKLVDHASDEHERLMRHAEVEMSAFFNFAPFDLNSLGRKNSLVRAFILHGMDQSDLSQHYSRMGLDLYCIVTGISKDFYVSGKSLVDISEKNIQVTGMPRYDLLREMKKKKAKKRDAIVIAPTWRRFLLYKPGTVEKQPDSLLGSSQYYKNYTELFQSKELKKLSKRRKIILIPHPEMLNRIDEFNIPKYIEIKTYKQMGTKGLYKLALETDLFVSDFSSTIFDFAFLGANVAHFNFDEEDYYSYKQELYKSWFDIERDGFGPSIKTTTELVKYITGKQRIRRQGNIDTVWNQIPENSSELIYESIQDILKDRK